MADNATITVPDSQATPVNHDFDPVKIDGDTARYINYAEAFSVGRETLSATLKDGGKVRKVVLTLRVPRLITEVINGVDVPSAPDYAMCKMEFFVPDTWAEADTEDLVEISSQLLQNSAVISMIDKGEFVW